MHPHVSDTPIPSLTQTQPARATSGENGGFWSHSHRDIALTDCNPAISFWRAQEILLESSTVPGIFQGLQCVQHWKNTSGQRRSPQSSLQEDGVPWCVLAASVATNDLLTWFKDTTGSTADNTLLGQSQSDDDMSR